MSLFSHNKTEDTVPVNDDTVFNLFEDIRCLKEELSDFVEQYGCECGHPACKRCEDTNSAKELLSK